MKRKNVLLLVLMLLLLSLGLQACSSASDKAAKEETLENERKKSRKDKESSSDETDETQEGEEEDSLADEDMIVPGYELGEIPTIVTPKVPNLSIIEGQSEIFKLDTAERLSAAPGITITPVVIKEGIIVNGEQVAQISGDGAGQYSDEEQVLQTDGDGAGQYSDDNVVIQTDGDGSGQYTNLLTGVTLQVDGDGSGQYNDDNNGITFQVSADGSGMYNDSIKDISLMLEADGSATYNQGTGDLIIYNNGDGSGSYRNSKTGLNIENDGKGRATITKDGKEKIVKADPIEPVSLFEKLQPVPAVPPIEANGVLITLESGVLFDVDKYNIRPDAHEVLKSLAKILKDANIKSFEIDGHTDSQDTDEYNQTLYRF